MRSVRMAVIGAALVWIMWAEAVVVLAVGPAPASSPTAIPVGRFTAGCTLARQAPDDPILFPQKPGRSHLHDFFGTPVNAFTNLNKLRVLNKTSCRPIADKSAYWTPSLLALKTNPATGEKLYSPVGIKRVTVYYEQAVSNRSVNVDPPLGLRILTGDSKRKVSYPKGVSPFHKWQCANAIRGSQDFVKCSAALLLFIAFPNCWNGKRLDCPPAHKCHMAFPVTKRGITACPATHPITFARIRLRITYRTSGYNGWNASDPLPPLRLSTAAGRGTSAHADYVNGWEPANFAQRLQECIRVRNTPRRNPSCAS